MVLDGEQQNCKKIKLQVKKPCKYLVEMFG